VIVALGVSALAVDLPGHGHSDWRADRDYWPLRNADAVASLIRAHAPNAVCVVGMSLGGLTTIRLASAHPQLVGRAVIIDVTPSIFERQVSMSRAQRGTTALITGPREFNDIDEMVNAAAASAPHRSRSSIRRGVLHNARRLPRGTWAWRYDELDAAGTAPTDFSPLWRDLATTSVPIALVTGGDSVFVADTDRDEFRRRRPDAEIVTIAGAGHSVQSDQPLELAHYLRSFLLDDAANDR
jgi:pimeloyl-ACP methyl ester carboxylesterase